MSCTGRRLVATALATCLGVAALLYLELPLRAGPFPAPLVYGHPETWSGFWDIVLARQFQGDIQLASLPAKAVGLARFAGSQLGVLAWLVPPAFVVTALRFPRYALLSGVATAVTCLFASIYVNADIGRYYLGPALFAWSWLAIAAGTLVEAILARARRPSGAAIAGWAEANARDPAPRRRRDDPFDRPSGAGRLASGRRSPWPSPWPCWSPPPSRCRTDGPPSTAPGARVPPTGWTTR